MRPTMLLLALLLAGCAGAPHDRSAWQHHCAGSGDRGCIAELAAVSGHSQPAARHPGEGVDNWPQCRRFDNLDSQNFLPYDPERDLRMPVYCRTGLPAARPRAGRIP